MGRVSLGSTMLKARELGQAPLKAVDTDGPIDLHPAACSCAAGSSGTATQNNCVVPLRNAGSVRLENFTEHTELLGTFAIPSESKTRNSAKARYADRGSNG